MRGCDGGSPRTTDHLWTDGGRQAHTRRGGGGTVRIIRSDGATLLNPHFATGLKDGFASRIFDEPLAERDADGNLIVVLAAAIPSRENGGLASDSQTVT